MTSPAAFQDFANWKRFVQIENLKGDPPIVPYRPNTVQQDIAQRWVRADREGRPFRIVVLKARRMGLSTFFQTRFAHRACTRNHFRALTIAQDHDAATYLFGMTEGIYNRLPEGVRPPKQRSNVGRLMMLANGSALRTDTAGNKQAGRGKGNRAVHASEVAFWAEAEKTMLALRQTVATEPGTAFIEESTPNGVGNYFHSSYLRAKRGAGGYEAVFYPWHAFAEYDLKGLGKTVKILDSREERLLELYGVSRDQLAWRRMAIEDLCGGDEKLFDQEYPESDEVAFLTSGRLFFTGVDRLRAVQPSWVGDLRGMPAKGGEVRGERDSDGSVRIWEKPNPGERYALFLDVAGQATGSEYEARRGSEREDFSAGYVISLDSARLVASMHGRWGDHEALAIDAARLGVLYNKAWLAVERTGGYGGSVLLILDRQLMYPRLYRDRRYTTHGREELGNLGWNTTLVTRPLMLDALRSVARNYPDRIVDEGLIDEMRTFVIRHNASARAEKGCYDDRVMAAGGAYAIFNELALERIDLRPERAPRRPVSFLSRAPRAILSS